jgi:hypothetical protein
MPLRGCLLKQGPRGSVVLRTTDAIRRFELDNGLPITGKPVDRVIARLKTIGATASN